jgi:hypothetical protein
MIFQKKAKEKVPLWFGTCDALAKSLDFFFWPKKATMASSHKYPQVYNGGISPGQKWFWK